MIRHAADDRGRPVLLIDGDDELGSTLHQGHHGLPSGNLEIIDVAPVPLPQRQRARLQLAGFLTPLPPRQAELARERLAAFHPVQMLELLGHRYGLLLLEVVEITLDSFGVATCIPPQTYVRAAVDPLAPFEAEFLTHLARAHTQELRAIARLLRRALPAIADACPDAEQARAHPLSIDRYGLRLRITGGQHDQDVHLRFSRPLDHPHQAADAIADALHDCPTHAHLHSSQHH